MPYTDPMNDDLLDDATKQILPAVVRVSFPVADLPTSACNEVADALQALADQYRALYRGYNLTAGREDFAAAERSRRMETTFCLSQFRNTLKRIAYTHGTVIREGRPKACNGGAQSENSFGTSGFQPVRFTQQIDRKRFA